MANITSCTGQQLEFEAGSTRLILDKGSGKAILHRKILFWPRKPWETPLADVQDVAVHSVVDAASGAEVCHTKLVTRPGTAWVLLAADKSEAEKNAEALRDFLGLAA